MTKICLTIFFFKAANAQIWFEMNSTLHIESETALHGQENTK